MSVALRPLNLDQSGAQNPQNHRSSARLNSLKGIENRRGLQHLDLNFCKGPTSLEAVSNHKRPLGLNLRGGGGDKISFVEEIQSLTKLTDLNLNNWACLSCIKKGSNSTSLIHVNLEGCSGIAYLEGLESMKKITHLNLTLCSGLKSIEEVGSCTSLTDLNLDFCINLLSTKGIGNCKALKSLNIIMCVRLTSLEGLEELKMLKDFSASFDSVCQWEINDVRRVHPLVSRAVYSFTDRPMYLFDWLKSYTWTTAAYALRKLKKMIFQFVSHLPRIGF